MSLLLRVKRSDLGKALIQGVRGSVLGAAMMRVGQGADWVEQSLRRLAPRHIAHDRRQRAILAAFRARRPAAHQPAQPTTGIPQP